MQLTCSIDNHARVDSMPSLLDYIYYVTLLMNHRLVYVLMSDVQFLIESFIFGVGKYKTDDGYKISTVNY